jgi:hypothetical protein
MKKKSIAVAITLIIILSFSTMAYAFAGFNKSVFDTAADVSIKRDDMTGDFIAETESLLGSAGLIINEDGTGGIQVYSAVGVTDSFNMDTLIIKSHSYDWVGWAFIDSVIFKIGNTRYRFDNARISRNFIKGSPSSLLEESIAITITSASLPMMTDLVKHRDEEIHVRLVGDGRDIDFILTDDMKNSIINLYNLYVAGGGTSKASMERIDKLCSDILVTVGQD